MPWVRIYAEWNNIEYWKSERGTTSRLPLLPICQSHAVGRYFVDDWFKTEIEYVMMKKRIKEQDELKEEENKQNN